MPIIKDLVKVRSIIWDEYREKTSVEWRFYDEAIELLTRRDREGKSIGMGYIVFENVFSTHFK